MNGDFQSWGFFPPFVQFQAPVSRPKGPNERLGQDERNEWNSDDEDVDEFGRRKKRKKNTAAAGANAQKDAKPAGVAGSALSTGPALSLHGFVEQVQERLRSQASELTRLREQHAMGALAPSGTEDEQLQQQMPVQQFGAIASSPAPTRELIEEQRQTNIAAPSSPMQGWQEHIEEKLRSSSGSQWSPPVSQAPPRPISPRASTPTPVQSWDQSWVSPSSDSWGDEAPWSPPQRPPQRPQMFAGYPHRPQPGALPAALLRPIMPRPGGPSATSPGGPTAPWGQSASFRPPLARLQAGMPQSGPSGVRPSLTQPGMQPELRPVAPKVMAPKAMAPKAVAPKAGQEAAAPKASVFRPPALIDPSKRQGLQSAGAEEQGKQAGVLQSGPSAVRPSLTQPGMQPGLRPLGVPASGASVECKFFAQGYCMRGTGCKFRHSRGAEKAGNAITPGTAFVDFESGLPISAFQQGFAELKKKTEDKKTDAKDKMKRGGSSSEDSDEPGEPDESAIQEGLEELRMLVGD